MTVSLVHAFESVKADGVDSTVVQPSNWNEEHVLTMATAKVLGRATAATGAVEELPIVVDTTMQSMKPPAGTTAQRPAPVDGMIRFNTTTGQLEAYQNSAWGNFSDIAMTAMLDSTLKGRAVGSGTGAPADLTRAQVQRLVYNIGTAYPTFNATADDGFIFPYGQNLNRTTHALLFAKWGTTYGAGDGSTTFGCPDGVSANRLTDQTGGLNGDTLGAAGGSETHVLTEAQLAAHDHDGTFTGTLMATHGHTLTSDDSRHGANGQSTSSFYTSDGDTSTGGATTQATSNNSAGTPAGTIDILDNVGGEAHNNVQPTIICNYQVYTGVHA
jgi:microcystin-dependent protein